MRFPYAQPIPQSQETLTVFRGLNQTLSVGDGEFAAMGNMTGDHYPVLSPRDTRLNCFTFTKCNGIYGKDHLLWIDGTALWYNGVQVSANAVADSKKVLVGMGAYVLIFPDKKVFNIQAFLDGDTPEILRSIVVSFTTVADIQFSMCDIDGNIIDYDAGTDPPQNPESGDYWLDESGENPSLKRYSSATEEWVAISTAYVRLDSTGIGGSFRKYDGVTISGASDAKFNGDFILYGADSGYIMLQATLNSSFTQQDGEMTVTRSCPNMDFLTECNNRVWGCAAGVHEIYACRLGDPFNWRAYEDVSTASYAVTVGTDGAFTGCATFQGNPVFFKENAIHKILGSIPANFALSVTNAAGVQYGSAASIAQVNGKLFYKAVNGVMAYDGGLPYEISDALGKAVYKAAVGGSAGNKYYLCMRDAANAYHLFVFDTKTGIWHREDNTQAVFFAVCGSDTFFVKNNVLWSVTKNEVATAFNETEETGMTWYAETGDQLGLMPDNKRLARIQLSVEMETGSSLVVYMKYDSGSTWEQALSISGLTAKRAYPVPFVPRRCNHFRMKLSGGGKVKVFAVTRVYEEGGKL